MKVRIGFRFEVEAQPSNRRIAVTVEYGRFLSISTYKDNILCFAYNSSQTHYMANVLSVVCDTNAIRELILCDIFIRLSLSIQNLFCCIFLQVLRISRLSCNSRWDVSWNLLKLDVLINMGRCRMFFQSIFRLLPAFYFHHICAMPLFFFFVGPFLSENVQPFDISV